MATSIFPTNNLGVSWGSYPSTSSEGYNTTPQASVSGSTISFHGDYTNGAHQGLIYNNYVAYVNLSNYKKITLTTSAASIWALGDLQLVVQSSSGATATKIKSVQCLGATTVSLDVSDLTGSYYVGIYCMLNSYSDLEHNPSGTITITDLSLEISNVSLDLFTTLGIASTRGSGKFTPGQVISINATVKDGYHWKTWSGNDIVYLVNDATQQENKVNIPEQDIILTAVAEGNTYYVQYNANGGSGNMSNSTHIYGTSSALTANSFTNPGYIFSGWATSTTGTKVYNDKASISGLTTTAEEVVDLYAVWTAINYTVKYNANGGAGNIPNDLSVNYNEEFTTEGAIFTKDGYVLSSWNTNAGGTGTSYALNTKVKNLTTINNDKITLYAQWKQMSIMFIYYNGVWKAVQ